jgi:hypothetical protein
MAQQRPQSSCNKTNERTWQGNKLNLLKFVIPCVVTDRLVMNDPASSKDVDSVAQLMAKLAILWRLLEDGMPHVCAVEIKQDCEPSST